MRSDRAWLPWLFVAVALALVGSVAAMVASSLAPLPGAGFEQRVQAGTQCDGAPAASFVREPFVREEAGAAPRCVQWTASLVARTKMHLRLEMTLEGGGAVLVDGRTVVTDEGASPARARSEAVDLAPGVHSFLASFRVRTGAAYFRLGMVDERDPHPYSLVPPLDDDAFYVRAVDAERALAARPRPRPVWRALFAGLALTGAGVLVWLALRLRRRPERAVPAVDLAIAAAIFSAALFVRARGVPLQDTCWDEGILAAGQHYVRNVVLGDFFAEAWRHNLEHPPITKWLLAFGDILGGLEGSRVLMCVLSAIAAAFLFAFGRIAFGRGVGVAAGAIAVVLPLWVAYGRIAGHESVILFWWCGSMLALACWLASKRDVPGGPGDSLAAFVCVFAATAGVFSRPTGIWIFPVLALGWLVHARGTLLQRLRSLPLAALAGGVVALAVTYAAWPFVWSHPAQRFARMAEHWQPQSRDIEVYLGKLSLPAAHYFLVAFLSETPALLLVAAIAGVALSLRDRRSRPWAILCLLWLVLPFGQSVTWLRIGAGRYVVQAWPALLLFAGVALVALGDFLAGLAFDRSKGLRALLRALPVVLAVVYTGEALAGVEPYPLDYFDEIVGGPSGVAARKMFEVPWWGEGNLAAVRTLNRVAPANARVHLFLWPEHAVARLRDDLVPVEDAAMADYVLVSHLQYFARAPAGCVRASGEEVAGAPLVDVYRCTPVSQTQLGFAAMNRPNGADEAMTHFRAELAVDPRDPSALFGLGWASQAKGSLPQAEALYVEAASRAAAAGDAETEYFARFDLGTLYMQRGAPERAVDAFRGAIAVTDRSPDRFADRLWVAWFNLGRALAASARIDDARAALLRAASLRPNEPSIAEALGALGALTSPGDAGRDAR